MDLRRLLLRLGGLLAVGAALSACSMFENLGGAKKSAPDEFRITTQAPLAMPPDVDLRPPRPGAPRPQDTPPADQARALVTGKPTPAKPAAASGAEGALLARAGTERADPNIRGRVNEDSRVIAQNDQGFLNWLIFWQESPPPGKVVDPVAEQRRLRESQAAGTPATGDTPQIERRKRGFLEGIF